MRQNEIVKSYSVRHRIDGLENVNKCGDFKANVRHRIDGLEIN